MGERRERGGKGKKKRGKKRVRGKEGRKEGRMMNRRGRVRGGTTICNTIDTLTNTLQVQVHSPQCAHPTFSM